jgi:hypothetical protein
LQKRNVSTRLHSKAPIVGLHQPTTAWSRPRIHAMMIF